MSCPDGKPHHRMVEGYGEDMRGVCKRCGDEQRYACTMQDIAWKRWEYRKNRATPAVSSMGGTL